MLCKDGVPAKDALVAGDGQKATSAATGDGIGGVDEDLVVCLA